MSFAVVYNPSFSGTARRVAQYLDAIMVPYTALNGIKVDNSFLRRAIHFAYPSYENTPKRLAVARSVFRMDKRQQRSLLQLYFNVPTITNKWTGKVVVRDAMHTRGSGFMVVDGIKDVPIWAGYVSPLIERLWEARIVIAFGKVVFAYKRFGEDQCQPWGIPHGARVEIVSNFDSLFKELGSLRSDLNAFFKKVMPDVVGFDVAKTIDGDYVMFEMNFAPGTPVVDGRIYTEMPKSIAEAARAAIAKGGKK